MMITFKTAKGDFLIIEDTVIGDADMIHYSKVSKDMWQLVGKSEQLTEDQAKEVVDDPKIIGIEQYNKPDDLSGWTIVNKPMGVCYNRVTSIKYYNHKSGTYCFHSALESIDTLFESIGVLWENPLGAHPVHPSLTGEGISILEYEYRVNSWQAAQEKFVWDKSRTYLFRKV